MAEVNPHMEAKVKEDRIIRLRMEDHSHMMVKVASQKEKRSSQVTAESLLLRVANLATVPRAKRTLAVEKRNRMFLRLARESNSNR